MKAEASILVLDDEPAICAVVKRCLEPGGYRVQVAHRSEEFRRSLRRQAFDLLILDLNLGGEDGLTIMSEVQRETALPIIILTGRGEPVDRVVGLEMGADDYVAKPFEPRELLARVRSVLRRARKPATAEDLPRGHVLWFAGFTLDAPARVLVAPSGAPVALTASEFDILHALAAHPNRALSRNQIMNLARSKEATPFDRSVDVHVGHLRRKIEQDPQEPCIIKTVHGVGYMFAAKVEARAGTR